MVCVWLTCTEAETVSGVSLESNLSSIDTGVAHTVETMTQIMSASAGRKKKRQTNAPTCTAASTTSTNSTTTDSTSINCSLVVSTLPQFNLYHCSILP